ncbi:MAG: hypothetical protein CMH52_00075 [Myxococcales bacterium]|nr:hypothetical protein [Myxococcales bacterium]|tara:strand:+ start:1711 stop:2067 length:357 start_codon:yes stop_codon:yes gene_type:complete
MQMQEQLTRLVDDVDGALGAALLNSDGIVVHAVEPGKKSSLAHGLSEFGLVAKQLTSLNELSELGEPLSFKFDSSDRTLLLRPLGPNYFVALWLKGAHDALRAQFQLRIVSADLMAFV